MTDIYGGLELPMPQPGLGEKAPDPALDAIGAYLKATLADRLGSAWETVAPNEQGIVRGIQTVNPKDSLVAPNMLPGLFLWRGPSAQSRDAEDYLITRTQLGCIWLLWYDSPIKREKRLPFQGAVTKAIHEQLARGRSPAWVVPGDTTEGAAERGSVLKDQAGLLEPIERINATEIDVYLEHGATPVAYKALSLTIQIAERMVRDPSLFFPTMTDTQNPDNASVAYPNAAALDLTVQQSDDNTVEQLQPAP